MHSSSNLQVDIVASRDLVRAFQRRIRGVVDIPASKLALDVIDAPTDTVDGGFQNQQQMAEEAQQQQQREQERHRRVPSSYQMLRRGGSKASAGPKMENLSLHDSLVAAVASDRSTSSEAAASTSSSSSFLSKRLASQVDHHKEEAAQRLKNAYREHRSELKTKFHPGKQVTRAQTETIPVILERECNSHLRHASSTRCYYFDHRTCRSDGVAFGYRGKLSPDDVAFDDCDVTLRKDGTAADDNEQQQQQRREDEARLLQQQKRGDSSPVILKYKQRHPVPIEERQSWTFVSPVEEQATELLRRRQAVTPPRPISVPTPHEQKRRHISPVAGTSFWQPCYAVEDE